MSVHQYLLNNECAVRRTPLITWKSPLWKRFTISVNKSGHFWGKSSRPIMLIASLSCERKGWVSAEPGRRPAWELSSEAARPGSTAVSLTCFWICSGLLSIRCTMLALMATRSASQILLGSSSTLKQNIRELGSNLKPTCFPQKALPQQMGADSFFLALD